MWNDIWPLSFNTDGYVGKHGYDTWLVGWSGSYSLDARVKETKSRHTFYMARYLCSLCEITLFTSASGGSKECLSDKPEAGFESSVARYFPRRDPRDSWIPASGAILIRQSTVRNTVESGYNDVLLCDTSSIASDILW
jgi:hypothetical protein